MPLIGFDRRELDKVLSEISLYAETVYGKEAIFQLPILHSLTSIVGEQQRIKKLQEFVVKNSFTIPYLDDIRNYLLRSEKVDFLSEEEAGFIFINLNALVAFLERFENLNLNYVLGCNFPFTNNLKEVKEELLSFLTERGKINPNCSDELKKITLEKEFLREAIIAKLEKMVFSKSNIFQDKYYTVRDGRYVLPVKANFKKDIKGTVRDTSQSGDTLFIEPETISDLNDRIIFAEKKEEKEKKKILIKITEKIRKILKEIREALIFYGYIDSLLTRVKYLLKYDLYFPEIEEDNDICLYSAYHPLFINKSFVVKNDFLFSKDKKIFLITGPNGGGKTVSIKTIMMIILLTHMAIPVTAGEKSRVPFFKGFGFDMEDKQSIETGVSSFTSKMLLWKDIINNLIEDMIVFVDELGNFTNPVEGSAISLAFLDYLVNKGVRVVAGTHIDEIKEYVFTRKDGVTSSMLWDEKEQKPTYKISYGFYSGSFALEVLKKLGFEEDFIKKCESNLKNDYIYIEDLKKKQEREYLEILNIKKTLEEKEKELEKLREEKISLLKKIEDEKYQLLNKYSKDIELLKQKIGEEIKSLPKDQKLAREFYKAIDRESKDLLKRLSETKIIDEDDTFSIGDEVFLVNLNEKGKIIDIDGNNYNVLTGRLKVWVDGSAIRKIRKNQISKIPDAKKGFDFIDRDFVPEIDVRGKRIDEAIPLIDKFLDRSILSGVEKIKIIHGAGMGRLRENIHKFLKESPVVVSFSLGDVNERGGSYYTIVTLKR